jgi:hypothetical protein
MCKEIKITTVEDGTKIPERKAEMTVEEHHLQTWRNNSKLERLTAPSPIVTAAPDAIPNMTQPQIGQLLIGAFQSSSHFD